MRLRCLVCPPFKGVGFKFFPLAWVAGRCLGWGWVLLRFARTAQPGVSGSGLLLPVVDACRLAVAVQEAASSGWPWQCRRRHHPAGRGSAGGGIIRLAVAVQEAASSGICSKRAYAAQIKKRLQPCGFCLCGALWAILFLFWYRFPFWLFVACGGFWGLFWLIDFRAVCAACQVVNRAIQAFCNIKKNFD